MTHLARAHLELKLAQVRWMVQRHMRRYASRMVQASGGYSDRCVGPLEFQQLIGQPAPEQPQKWLDQHRMPDLATITQRLDETHALERRFLDGLSVAERAVLPLERLRGRFELSPRELEVLVAAAAPYLSEDMMRLMTVAWSDFTTRRPTVGFVASLASASDDDHARCVEALSSRGKLARFGLIAHGEQAQLRPATPELFSALLMPQRVLDAIAGAPLDAHLPDGGALHGEPAPLDALFAEDAVRDPLLHALDRPRPRLLLIGPPRAGRRTLAAAALWAVRGQRMLEVDLAGMARRWALSDAHAGLVQLVREAMMLDAGLYLHVEGPLDSMLVDQLQSLMHRAQGSLRQTASPVILALPEPHHVRAALLPGADELTLGPLPVRLQVEVWRRALAGCMPDDDAERTAQTYAHTYSLPTGSIVAAVQNAKARQALQTRDAAAPLQPPALLKEVHRQFDHNLGQLADTVTSSVRLRDVILSGDQRRQLTEVFSYARHAQLIFQDWGFAARSPYGNGLSVLFSGPPGTGKTLVAGALARELNRVLYKVDLSRIVDKYIGETEKNLAKIFDEAERAQAVLLFDEADSLFAKRTEVKSSNDRYANLEVNFLLQRMEQFVGVSILTTNFDTGLDEAFMRRIRFKIEFPMPDEHERARLWQHLLPPDAPRDEDIDWELLGESFEMSGGHIRNALLRAAVRAAACAQPISHDMLMLAAIDEARELGVLVNVRAEFGDIEDTFTVALDREVFGDEDEDEGDDG